MTEFSISRFMLKVFAGALALLILMAAVAWQMDLRERTHLAKQLATAITNDLLLGDTRSAMVTLNPSILRDFKTIRYISGAGQSLFELGTPLLFGEQTIRIPVKLSEESTSQSRLEFTINSWPTILNAVLIWFFLAIINLPLLWIVAKKLEAFYKRVAREQSLARVGEITRQLAHDIRSPLSALRALSPRLTFQNDDETSLYTQVLTRLENIAEDVLQKAKRDTTPKTLILQSSEFRHLVENVLVERKATWATTRPIEIELNFNCATSIAAEAKILARILSNLMQNSWEAGATLLNIGVEQTDSRVTLSMRDNGCGISMEHLSKIGQEGFSLNKPGGNGLGIFSARQTLDSWGGSIELSSAPGAGTKVQLFFKPLV